MEMPPVKKSSDSDSPTKKLFTELFKELFKKLFKRFFTVKPTIANSTKISSIWYINSAATYHITSDKKAFSSYKKVIIKNEIQIGDNKRFIIIGTGNVIFANEILLIGVKHIPDLYINLLTLEQLDEYSSTFTNDIFILKIGNQLIIVFKINSLYPLVTSAVATSYDTITITTTIISAKPASNKLKNATRKYRKKTLLWR